MFQQPSAAFSFAPGTDLTAPSMFGTTPFSNQFGNQMGMNILGGLDKMASITNFGMSTASMLNPALLPVALAANVGKYATGQFLQGAQQQVAVDNMLNRAFRNRDMGGNMGLGVSREGAKQFTDSMRSLAHLPEMMTSDRELMSVFQKLTDMKMLQSSKNLKEMTGKFETAVKTMRQMSMDLNKTMEEMAPIMQQSIQSGFFSFEDMRRNAALNKYTQNVGIGFSDGRIEGLQQFGSSTFRAMGGSRQLGAGAARDMAGKLSVAMQQGKLNEAAISEYTGKQGEDAIADIAQQLVSGNARLLQQTEQGKLITAYLAEQDSEGKFTGKLDRSKLDSLGKVNLDEISKVASQKLSKKDSAVSFMNEYDKGLGANLSSQMGAGGLQDIIQSITKDKNFSREEQRKLIKDLGGFDMQFTDILIDSAKGMKEVTGEFEKQLRTNEKRARLASQIEYQGIGAKIDRFKTEVNRHTAKPLQEMGAEFLTDVSTKFDRIGMAFNRGHFGKLIDEFNFNKTAKDAFFGRSDAFRENGLTQSITRDALLGRAIAPSTIGAGTSDKYKNLYDIRKEDSEDGIGSSIKSLMPDMLKSSAVKDFTNIKGRDAASARIKQIMTSSLEDLKNEFKGKEKQVDQLIEVFKDAARKGLDKQQVIDKLVPVAQDLGIDVAAFLRLLAETPEYAEKHGELTQDYAKNLSTYQKNLIGAGVHSKKTAKEIGEIQKKITDLGVEGLGDNAGFFTGGGDIGNVYKKNGGSIGLKEAIAKLTLLVETDKKFAAELGIVLNPNNDLEDRRKGLGKLLSKNGINLTSGELESMTDGLLRDLHALSQGAHEDQVNAAREILQNIDVLKKSQMNQMSFDIEGAESSSLFKESKIGSLLTKINDASTYEEKQKLIMDNIDVFKDVGTLESLGLDSKSNAGKTISGIKDIQQRIDSAGGDKNQLLKQFSDEGVRKEYEKKSVEEIKQGLLKQGVLEQGLQNVFLNQDQAAIDDQTQGYNMDLANNMVKVNEQSLKFAEAVGKVIEGQSTFNANVTESVKKLTP